MTDKSALRVQSLTLLKKKVISIGNQEIERIASTHMLVNRADLLLIVQNLKLLHKTLKKVLKVKIFQDQATGVALELH